MYPNTGDGDVICFPGAGGARCHFGGTDTKKYRSDFTFQDSGRFWGACAVGFLQGRGEYLMMEA